MGRKIKTFFLIAFASFLLIAFKSLSKKPSTWQLDKANSTLDFSINRVAMSPVKGQVKSFNVVVTSSEDDFSDGVVEMTAEVNSMTTGIPKRDKELKGDNYFDMEKFPVISFRSTSFKKINETNYTITGDLTMHGITKPVTMEVIYVKAVNAQTKKMTARFKSSCKINRNDFNIGSGPSSAIIGREVHISAETEFVKSGE